MGIAFDEGAALEPDDYRRLRRAVGWGDVDRSDEQLRTAFGRTWNVVARREDDVVGVGRLLEDGVLYASIWDMIVDPEVQKQGVGGGILTRLLARAETRSLTVLVATAAGQPLYEKHGFVPADAASVAMLRRRT